MGVFGPSTGPCSVGFLCSGCSWLSFPLPVSKGRVGCSVVTVLLEGTVSAVPHPPQPPASPPLSAQSSSSGRGSCRTFLRIDGVTEAVRPGEGPAPSQSPEPPQRTQSSTWGPRAGKALLPPAAWPGRTRQARAEPRGRGSVGHAELAWAQEAQCRSLGSRGDGRWGRGGGRGRVGRSPLPSRDQKRGPGTGRGGIWVLLAPLRSRSGRRLAPGPASCRC